MLKLIDTNFLLAANFDSFDSKKYTKFLSIILISKCLNMPFVYAQFVTKKNLFAFLASLCSMILLEVAWLKG